MWQLTEETLNYVALGAGILGTGGGGNPYLGQLRVRQLVREYGPVNILAPEELDDDAQVVALGGIGAPTVGVEKIRGTDSFRALKTIEAQTGKKVTAVIPGEVGGSNSLEPAIAASLAGIPVVDGDGMGRAFPELQMCTYLIYGVPFTPTVICDEKGNTAIFTEALNPVWVERMSRAVTVQMGCVAIWAFAPMTAEQVRRTAIPHTMSLARDLGMAVVKCQKTKTNPIESILDIHPGRVLFSGKVTDVQRRTVAGFARGNVTIEGVSEFNDSRMEIEFQNENLIAKRDGQVICTVPDLICIVDTDRGEPITTELLRYGFRVTVLGFPAHELLKSSEALNVIGPKAFGYDEEFIPMTL